MPDNATPEIEIDDELLEELPNDEGRQIEDDQRDTGDTAINYSITSYGIDFDVAGLVRRLVQDNIVLPAYQRKIVWKSKQRSTFIESLLIGLPIPGIFLYKEGRTGKLQIVDGHQRLSTLDMFFKNEFRLGSHVDLRFRGKKFSKLEPEYVRLLEDSIIHATIIEEDVTDNKKSAVYAFYHRINTNSTPLSTHEVRYSISHGKFIELLKQLNSNVAWREIFGSLHPRLKDEEAILRFFALYFKHESYTPTMSKFLDDFIESNLDLECYSAEVLMPLFVNTITLIQQAVGDRAFRKSDESSTFVITMFDAVMVGLAKAMASGKTFTSDEVASKYLEIQSHGFVSEDGNEGSGYLFGVNKFTNDKIRVDARLSAGIEVFSR